MAFGGLMDSCLFRCPSAGLSPRSAMVIAILLGFSVALEPVRADDDRREAQRAISAGEVASLQRLLTQIRRDFGGRVLKVELEQEHYAGNLKWIYEAKILTDSGHVVELEYDARALELLEVEGHYEYDE